MQTAAHLSEQSLRSGEDSLVDELIAPGVEHGAVLILASIGRAYVDLNRAPDDFDPVLIDGVAPTPSARARAGYGVIPRLTGDGKTIHDRRLTLAEVEKRLDFCHRPYHAALEHEMCEQRAMLGRATLIDWHSMPGGLGGSSGLQVVIGDRHGSSCDSALSRKLRRLFEAEGLRVAMNHPYAGGWTTERWGRPTEGFHAIQVELSRALYCDEATRQPNQGWDRTVRTVSRVIAGLAGRA